MNPIPPLSSHAGRAARRVFFCLILLPVGFGLLRPALGQGPAAGAVARPGVLSGLLQDSTGAIIPDASIVLQHADGTVASTARTDSAGQFRIGAAIGQYNLSIVLPGFEPLLQPVKVVSGASAPLRLTMNLASVATTVEVNASDAVDMAAPENNQDSATMSADDMKTLPILDGDVVATLSAFLDSGAAGEGGASLIVDGVEMKTLGVSPSAIERVSINQNPYSAQYRQPGRGQVEVITKNTADKYHGAATFTFRDASLNGTNYFATTKPPGQRRTYEGFLTGPIRPLRDTTFLFSVTRQEQDSYAQVNATTGIDATTGAFLTTTGNVPTPYRNSQLTMKLAHQINDHHSAFLLYRFFDNSTTNQGVGGLVESTAGYTAYNFDMDVTFHDDDAFATNKLNQFNILFERNIDRDVSNTQAPQVQVQGSFVGGGAQNDSLQTENNPNISDIVSWTTHRIHQLKFGVQLPNLGRRVLEDMTNRQGTYVFGSVPNCLAASSSDTHCSALATYQAAAPASFTIQLGQTRFLTHYEQPGAFFQDQIQLTPRLTVTPGVRYDFQNALPGTMNAVQPKLAVAYVLDKDHGLVVRTGGGVYMRRVGVNVGQQLARYQYAAERNVLLTTAVTYPEAGPFAAQPPSLFNFMPNLKAPFQGYFGTSVERELTKKSTLTIGYEGYRGWHALQSVDINAPLPPFTSAARPNSAYAQILQLQSGGVQRSDALIVSFRGRLGKVFSGFSQYTWQHARADTEWSTFTPQNQYAPNDEYGRLAYDQRQRLAMFGTFYPDKPLNLGIGFFDNTPMPYTETTGVDSYHTGFFNARPAGIPRNSLNGGDYQDLQARLGYTLRLKPKQKDPGPTVALSLSSFNTLNRVNYETYVGVESSPKFMQPTAAGNPRVLQLGAAYNF